MDTRGLKLWALHFQVSIQGTSVHDFRGPWLLNLLRGHHALGIKIAQGLILVCSLGPKSLICESLDP